MEGLQLGLSSLPDLSDGDTADNAGTSGGGWGIGQMLWAAGDAVYETVLSPLLPSFGFGTSAESIDLEQCLTHYFGEERMTHENRYACDACGKMRDAHRRTHLTRLPNLLMITLKRFE
jgi:hypothetical protein